MTVQINSLFKLNNGRRGELTSASFGKNSCRLCREPISDINCFLDMRAFKSSTAWVFRANGVKPCFPIHKRGHSHSFFANSHFRYFKAAFDTSSFLTIFSTYAMWYILVSFDTTKMSFMKALALGHSFSKVSITFWISSGIEVSPKNSFLKR